MMAQGLRKSRAAGDPRSRTSKTSKTSMPFKESKFGESIDLNSCRISQSSQSWQPGATTPYQYSRPSLSYAPSLHMEDAQPPGLPPKGRLGDDVPVMTTPMAIRLKQPGQAAQLVQPAHPTGDNGNDSDSTESDVNSVFNNDADTADTPDFSHEQDEDEEQMRFAQCPLDGCCETVLADEMAYHIDMHAALHFEEKLSNAADVDTPIAEAARASLEGHRSEPTRPSSGRRRGEDRYQQCDPPSPHPHSHRERRERHRSGRESLPATPQTTATVPLAKHSSSSRKVPPNTPKPWWALFLSPPKRSAAANGKAKEVVVDGKGPSTKLHPKRLGKSELGKHADEERMPDKLAVYLKKEWGICHRGIIPVLKQLLEQSPTTEYAYLCDPCVQHVSRLRREGSFCGYRNLQTVISYIISAKYPGFDRFGHDIPSIFDLQNLIEDAWDNGINTRGRIETGGIRWTRKYIGTPEAATLFKSLGIPHLVRSYKHKNPEGARNLLLRDIEQYFQMGKVKMGHKVRTTTLPPIYWQHPGHSLTIVGIEKTTTGDTNLLVFDPNFHDGSSIVRVVGRRRLVDLFPDKLLKSYRRGSRYLSKYRVFETLRLQPRPEDLSVASLGH